MTISKEIETAILKQILEKLSEDALGVAFYARPIENPSGVSFTQKDFEELQEQIERMCPKCYVNKKKLDFLKKEFRSHDIQGVRLIGLKFIPENMAVWVMPDGSTSLLSWVN